MSVNADTHAFQFDPRAEKVARFLLSKPQFEFKIAQGLRKALDEVIDGARTGRFRVEQLEKTEKTYIGTKVEIVLRTELELERGNILDNLICGEEVDTKFSLSGNWMIPREAIDQLCLVVKANDNTGKFSVGIVRATLDALTPGSNQDGKRSLSAIGKGRIEWLIPMGTLPLNVLLNLDARDRERIMSLPSGLQRVRELFLTVTNQPIPRDVVAQVAQQKDPMRRARQMKGLLRPLGYTVLCATYESDRICARHLGFTSFGGNDWLSVPPGVSGSIK